MEQTVIDRVPGEDMSEYIPELVKKAVLAGVLAFLTTLATGLAEHVK